jgi:hypothetical protein
MAAAKKQDAYRKTVCNLSYSSLNFIDDKFFIHIIIDECGTFIKVLANMFFEILCPSLKILPV